MARISPFKFTVRTGLIIAVCLVLTSFAIGAAARRWASVAPPGEAGRPAPQQARDRVSHGPGFEVVTLTPGGFEPSEIKRPRGRFILRVANRSGLAEVDLRLQREAGGAERRVRVQRGRPDWNEEVDLEPGRYVLSAPRHTDWECRITITPHE